MALKDLVPSLWGNKNIPIRREGEQPFFALQNEMNRIFDNFFNDVDIFTGRGSTARISGFSPTVDILDNEKELTVKA